MKSMKFRTPILAMPCGLLCIGTALAQQPPQHAVTRCGWFANPTPANAWLTDRDGEWLIGMQGGHQADGDWPVFKDAQWVSTNVYYGYGCACLKVVADPRTHEVSRIVSARALPLKTCRQDAALKKPE